MWETKRNQRKGATAALESQLKQISSIALWFRIQQQSTTEDFLLTDPATFFLDQTVGVYIIKRNMVWMQCDLSHNDAHTYHSIYLDPAEHRGSFGIRPNPFLTATLKFIYSEKATKILRNLHLFLTGTSTSQKKVEISQKFCGLLRIYEL